jgi:hypothetical protein
MLTEGQDIDLPECDAPFLVTRLLEIGPVTAGATRMAPIGWRDIEAWQACTGVRQPPWQSRLLVELSREYVSFSRAAEKPDCPAPWSDEARTESRREAIARSLKIGFKALMVK